MFGGNKRCLWVVVHQSLLLGSQHHLEEPPAPVRPLPLNVRLPSHFDPDSYCVTVHPSFFVHSHCNYKPYTFDLFAYSYPFLGIVFLPRDLYPCSEFPPCTEPTCTAPTFVIYLSVNFYITSPHSPHFQFSFLLTKRPYSNPMQLPACSR